MNKNNAPGAKALRLKGTVIMPMESKGGGVNPVSVLFAVGISRASRPGSRYGLSGG